MSLTVTSSSHPPLSKNGVAATVTPASLTTPLQDLLTQDYAHARQQYNQAHAQYSARVTATKPSRFEQYCNGAFQDLLFYTSAVDPATCCAPSRCSHGPHKAGLHELNDELWRRARERMGAAAPLRRSTTGADVFALLVAQEAAEQADIVELEAEAFRKLAHTYYDCVYGPANRLAEEEARSRRQLEDARNVATVALLKEIREERWQAEQRLLLRAYGMCSELLPHQAQVRAAALTEEAEQRELNATNALDCSEAVPLWHRACVIRGETESEEDITFRRLVSACLVEAHSIEEGYLARDPTTKCLRWTGKAVPTYMRDAVDYALQFEQFALVLSEETERMAVVDAAAAAWSANFM